jgi:hypothetical protein
MENPKPVWPSQAPTITPPQKRIKPISNVVHVREHMIRIWKEARRGDCKVEDASKLIFMLVQIQRSFETSDLAERIKALEQSQ